MTATVVLSLISCEKEKEQEPLYSLSANPLSLQFQASGNTAQTITVTSKNMSWSASVNDNGEDWITVEYDKSTIKVSVADNGDMEPRQGSITIIPDITEVEPVSITVEQAGKSTPDAIQLSTEGIITYYAQNFIYNTNGNDEWLIQMCTEDSEYEISWVNFGKDGYWSYFINNGRSISLYLYTTPGEDFFNPDITDGTYTACYEVGTMEPMTMLASTYYSGTPWPQGSVITDYTNGESTYTDILDGTALLEHNGNEYHIYMELTLADESRIAYEFSGEMKPCTLGNPPYYSDLTEDLTIGQEEIAQSAVVSSYANLNNPDITEWKIQFLGEGLTAGEWGTISGNGYFINTHLFAPASETETIPEGKYDINILDAYSYVEEFTAMIGSYNPVMGNSGCYIDIYDGDNLDFAPMSSGTVNVKYLGEGNYRFEIAAMDDNGHNITFTYEGYVMRADS